MVVPVYNNAATLPELCHRVRAALPDRPLELVFVDDGSTDDSLAVLTALNVDVIKHERNRGQNAAVLSGLARASHPLTCVVDADLEDPPEELPKMLDALGPAHVVFSSRDEARPLSSRTFRWLIQRLFPTLPPHPCLCFAIDEDGRTRLLRAARDHDYLPAVVGMLKLPAVQVTVARGTRKSASGLAGTKRARYAAGMLAAAIWVRLRSRTGDCDD